MDLMLSWDLFIIVFFAIVAAYSFILGREATMKIIIATYVGTICADGVGNIVQGFVENGAFFSKLVNFVGFAGGPEQFGSLTKILIFIGIIVALTIWGDYHIDQEEYRYSSVRLGVLSVLAILSGGLILSTIIVFANGGSLIDGTAGISAGFIRIYQESRLVRLLLDWHDIWFALPGMVFVIISILQRNREKA